VLLDPPLHDHCSQAFDYIRRDVLAEQDWSALQSAIAAYEKIHLTDSKLTSFYLLPVFGSIAVGGKTERATPLTSAWILYDLASDIFDDLQDQDKKNLPWMQWTPDQAMLVGIAALFAAQRSIVSLDVDERVIREIQRAVSDAGLQAARGQALLSDTPSLHDYFHRTIANTGLVLATMVWAGGRLYTDDPKRLSFLYSYGLSLGVLLQMWDDCIDLSPSTLVNDLARRHYTLPIIYALSQTENPGHKRLCYLVKQAGNLTQDELCEVMNLLNEMHASRFVTAMAAAYEFKALSALHEFPTHNISLMRTYVEQISKRFAGG